MVEVQDGSQRIALDPLVQEAAEALGYFRSDAVPAIADRIAGLWGNSDHAFAMDGERVRPFVDQPKRQISAEIWESLTASGKEDPFYACKATFLRVVFAAYRVRDAASEKVRRQYARTARFSGITQYTCAAGRACEGRTVSLRKRLLGLVEQDVKLPSLPLPSCDADWCACNWMLLSDRQDR